MAEKKVEKKSGLQDNLKYETAMHQLEEIVEKMENDELDIDSLTGQLEKAKKLIRFCKDRLTKTDEEIRQILEKDQD